MELILFVDLQASGKTTFYVERFLNTHARISLDQLRTRAREKRFFDLCLETRMPVVVDNTNPTQAERRRYVDAAKAAGYDVHCYFFQSRARTASRETNRGRKRFVFRASACSARRRASRFPREMKDST